MKRSAAVWNAVNTLDNFTHLKPSPQYMEFCSPLTKRSRPSNSSTLRNQPKKRKISPLPIPLFSKIARDALTCSNEGDHRGRRIDTSPSKVRSKESVVISCVVLRFLSRQIVYDTAQIYGTEFQVPISHLTRAAGNGEGTNAAVIENRACDSTIALVKAFAAEDDFQGPPNGRRIASRLVCFYRLPVIWRPVCG